jgi:purine-nucleoside phosphorylase
MPFLPPFGEQHEKKNPLTIANQGMGVEVCGEMSNFLEEDLKAVEALRLGTTT